jgi:hypothetical protein
MYRRPLIPAQQEKKEYNPPNEVGIPVAQALIAAVAVSFVVGWAPYLIIRAGPDLVRDVVGVIVFLGTVYLCFFRPVSRDAQVPGVSLGVILFVASQRAISKMALTWPEAWTLEEIWRNWFHTWYVGPIVGCIVLAGRMLREVWDPLRTGAPVYVGPEENSNKSKKRPYERVTYVHSIRNDNGDEVREQPVEVEEVWEEEVPGPTLKEHLLAFIVAASRIGLSKNAWLKPHTDRRILRTKLKVSKGEYDRLIGTLRGIGILSKPGPGEKTEWLIKPQKAFDLVNESVAVAENFEASEAMEREGQR